MCKRGQRVEWFGRVLAPTPPLDIGDTVLYYIILGQTDADQEQPRLREAVES